MRKKFKICSTCLEKKPATTEFFGRHSSCALGLNSQCKECRRAYGVDYRAKNSTFIKRQKRQDYRDHRALRCAAQHARTERAKTDAPFKARARVMLIGLGAARRAGIRVAKIFCSVSYLSAWLQRQPACECCGKKFELFPRAGKWSGASPSLDRLHPHRGYVAGNVSLICWRCNNIKRNYVAADLRMVAAWIERKIGQLSSMRRLKS